MHIIENDAGNRTTPSMVAFTDQERLVGEAARNQAAQNPTGTVFDAKRLIGCRFSGVGCEGPPCMCLPQIAGVWRLPLRMWNHLARTGVECCEQGVPVRRNLGASEMQHPDVLASYDTHP